MTDSIASRLDHYIWPDGSVSPGSPVYTYAQACAVYEKRRRKLSQTHRVTLFADPDGLGFSVGDAQWGQSVCRATPGNVWPHPCTHDAAKGKAAEAVSGCIEGRTLIQ